MSKFIIKYTSAGTTPYTIDFSRIEYIFVPTRRTIFRRKESLQRRNDNTHKALYEIFKNNENWAPRTKITIFNTLVSFIRFCDKNKKYPYCEESINFYIVHLKEKHRKGLLKDSSCRSKIKNLKSVFDEMSLPIHEWLGDEVIFGRTQQEPFQPYSKSDLNKLLKILYIFFNKLYSIFMKNQKFYIYAKKKSFNNHKYSEEVLFDGEPIKVNTIISKIACMSIYLVSFYTWGNTTQLYSLKRPTIDGLELDDYWIKMPTFKRRANKFVSLEIGDNDLMYLPNHATDLMIKIINFSRALDPNRNANLFNTAIGGTIKPLTSAHLSNFNVWFKKTFNLQDDFGRPLAPQIQRFRTTGIENFSAHKGRFEAGMIAANTPSTQDQHYSVGNKFENDTELQNTTLKLENSVRAPSERPQKKTLRDNFKSDFKIIRSNELVSQSQLPSRCPNGGSCGDPFGNQSERFAQQARNNKLCNLGEKLACANLIQCFLCSEQIIIETVEDIWCILSFKECLEESLYLHLDPIHFENNFGKVINSIDYRLSFINKNILNKAVLKLEKDGRHPYWIPSQSIEIISSHENTKFTNIHR